MLFGVFTVTVFIEDIRAELPFYPETEKDLILGESDELKDFGFDWYAPLVAVREPERTLSFMDAEFSTVSNEEITVAGLPDGWGFELIAKETEPEIKYHYLIKTSEIANGEYNYSLVFTDSELNSTVVRLKLSAPDNRLIAPNWSDPKYFMPADSLIAIANKTYRLPEDYIPTELVALGDYGISFANGAKVRKIVIEDLKAMTKAISAQGIPYVATSAYRSYLDQFNAYNYWLEFNDGDIEATDSVSARPGHSEHQLGVTIDFVTSENGSTFWQFENTRLAKWLAANAWQYGFVISYPKGKEQITGYSFEPWHYRYIGKENAKLQHESGLTLTEWLLEQNKDILLGDIM